MLEKTLPLSSLKTTLPWRDYWEMTKPKVVALMLLTALVGMCLAKADLSSLGQMFWGLSGIACMAGAAAALNHVIDRRIDGLMQRTQQRPVAQGRISTRQALLFAGGLGCVGFVMLWWRVNSLTAWLTLASLMGYALVYTRYLKRATPQNIVIGGLAGAMPPLLGWTAITGQFHGHGLLLVIIIFAWTPPHFWALAIARKADYARAGLPMLPVTHGEEYTKTQILLYSFLYALACLLPVVAGMSGGVYLVGAAALALWFLVRAWQLKYQPQYYAPMQLFVLSIWQLMALFGLLLVDHYWARWGVA
ncbi:MAG: heme o synthase [Ferrimonas sp.]